MKVDFKNHTKTKTITNMFYLRQEFERLKTVLYLYSQTLMLPDSSLQL